MLLLHVFPFRHLRPFESSSPQMVHPPPPLKQTWRSLGQSPAVVQGQVEAAFGIWSLQELLRPSARQPPTTPPALQ